MHSISKKLFTKHDSKNAEASNFLKENQYLGFSCCSTHDDLSIDVSITTDIDEARVI